MDFSAWTFADSGKGLKIKVWNFREGIRLKGTLAGVSSSILSVPFKNVIQPTEGGFRFRIIVRIRGVQLQFHRFLKKIIFSYSWSITQCTQLSTQHISCSSQYIQKAEYGTNYETTFKEFDKITATGSCYFSN